MSSSETADQLSVTRQAEPDSQPARHSGIQAPTARRRPPPPLIRTHALLSRLRIVQLVPKSFCARARSLCVAAATLPSSPPAPDSHRTSPIQIFAGRLVRQQATGSEIFWKFPPGCVACRGSYRLSLVYKSRSQHVSPPLATTHHQVTASGNWALGQESARFFGPRVRSQLSRVLCSAADMRLQGHLGFTD